MINLDNTDRKLLNLLQQNAKWTTKQFALALGLSNTAVYERIRRLEKKEVIKGYVALLDPEKIGRNYTVWCQVRLAQHVQGNVNDFEASISELPEVSECYHVSGDYDYVLKIQVGSMDDYRRFLVEQLTSIPSVGNTHSTFVIKEIKHSTAHELTLSSGKL